MKPIILIVDDELDIQSSLSFALKDEGFDVLTASSPAEAEDLLSKNTIDVGLYDVWFPVGDGIQLLKKTREKYPDMNIIMMSGHGNIETALKSIRMGAYDFLEKPLELEKVLVVLRNSLESLQLRRENKRLQKELLTDFSFIGESESFKNLKNLVAKVSQSHSHVLITGENGTGKELVAKQIHLLSSQKEKPYITVNCATLPEALFEVEIFGHEKGVYSAFDERKAGKFEQANEGTLFFDEISELPMNLQAKLLRVLENQVFERVGGSSPIKTSARVLAATNKNLSELVKEGKFRSDLYFRLNVLHIEVPELKNRIEDVSVLASYFYKLFSKDTRELVLEPQLKKQFESYDWPGNIRELKNLMEKICLMNPGIHHFTQAHLPDDFPPFPWLNKAPAREEEGTLRDLRAAYEARIIQERIHQHQGNISKAADSLGVERTHLHRKIKQLGIQ